MLLFVLRYGFQQVHKRCACHGYLLLIFSRKWRRYSGKLHHEVSLQRGENVSLCVSMINCKIVVVISLLIKMYECLEREKKIASMHHGLSVKRCQSIYIELL